MSLLDIFKADAFQLREMTDAINKQPFVPGRIGSMGLFQSNGITTLTAQIEEKEGILYLVPTRPRGAPGTQNQMAGRKLRPINTVHLPVDDRLNADEIQGVREFGTENQLETIQAKSNEKLQTMRQSIEATIEHHRMGAIKGIVTDADGSSVILDLFNTFEISPYPVVNFDLENTSPVSGYVRNQCHLIQRSMEDALGAANIAGVHGFVGKDFMDQLVSHPETIRAYERWQDGQALRESFARRTFAYAGIMFEEYRGKVGSVQYIEDDEARFFPLGVPGLFKTVYSPANFLETVNTVGLPVYAKSVVDPADRWVDLLVQSNPLCYCTRPKVLMQGLANS